jgi:type II secretory pathway pseudopilin PulG
VIGLRIGDCRLGIHDHALAEGVGLEPPIRHPKPEAGNPLRRSLTLAEMIVSMVIVGVMLVAALNTVGASKMGQLKTGDRAKGTLLAQQLMSEILRQSYEEQGETPAFGRETAELSTNRVEYDDVDDYDGWSASPPQRKDGTVIPGLEGWTRSVRVAWVAPADLSQEVAFDTRVKRITVAVAQDVVVVASMVALRTAAADVTGP